MEIFRTDDGLVGKYIHADGSETAIKSISSCDTVRDPHTGQFHHNPVERQKFSIFVSGSAGCFMRCAFCYLTIKGSRYAKLGQDPIFENVMAAVRAEREANPMITDRYAKICWMGMGEDHMLHPERTRALTTGLLDAILAEGHTRGLDGCDVASVIPSGIDDDRWIAALHALDADLQPLPYNPHNAIVVHSSNDVADYTTRSRVRFFWSLHSAIQETRDRLIPNARDLRKSAATLRRFRDETGLNLIIHHLFLDGVTDTPAEADAICSFLEDEGLGDAELRILRYNSCESSPMHEAKNFYELVDRVANRIPRVKVQISTGKEVTAACGQFIVRDFVRHDGRLHPPQDAPEPVTT